jgi:hypothetical protein
MAQPPSRARKRGYAESFSSSRTTASPITEVPTRARPVCMISAVRRPPASTFSIAVSSSFASYSSPKDQRSSMAKDSIWAQGLAMPRPAMSGAEPWIGSYSA